MKEGGKALGHHSLISIRRAVLLPRLSSLRIPALSLTIISRSFASLRVLGVRSARPAHIYWAPAKTRDAEYVQQAGKEAATHVMR